MICQSINNCVYLFCFIFIFGLFWKRKKSSMYARFIFILLRSLIWSGCLKSYIKLNMCVFDLDVLRIYLLKRFILEKIMKNVRAKHNNHGYAKMIIATNKHHEWPELKTQSDNININRWTTSAMKRKNPKKLTK